MSKNLSTYAIDNGGDLIPLILKPEYHGVSQMNPSVFYDDVADSLIVNIRAVNYIMYHSENEVMNHYNGPLTYLHPEDDLHLRTINYYCELTADNYDITSQTMIDFSRFDSKYTQMWDFRGLEDARLFTWGDKLFVCGVRRDTNPTGIGRMELCEVVVNRNDDGISCVEVDRHRIPSLGMDDSYCEKNWMPVSDMPYHFVKWTNPFELVEYNPTTMETHLVDKRKYDNCPEDLRGGSQIVRFGEFRIACVHNTVLSTNVLGQKDGKYRHRFVVWDLDWNVVKVSDEFSFMNANVEFCCGMTIHRGMVLISFGYQDNAAFILTIPANKLLDYE